LGVPIRFLSHATCGRESIMSVGIFDRFSNAVSNGSGKAGTFVAACALIVAWAVSGPIFQYSETWQLVVNTATTIITFLMVFVLQHTQNQDGEAVQAKLDELIFALKHADNRLIGAEHLDIKELHHLRELIAEQVKRGEEKLEQIDAKAKRLHQQNEEQ
jgi:low affinity Fe/Cu permease